MVVNEEEEVNKYHLLSLNPLTTTLKSNIVLFVNAHGMAWLPSSAVIPLS